MAARKDAAVIDFVRRAVAEAAAGTMIELGGDVVALALGESAEMSSLGQIRAEKASSAMATSVSTWWTPADRFPSPGATRVVEDKHTFFRCSARSYSV
jgi:hypothetical protein